MVHIIMRADVADYGKWRPVFDGLEELRRSKGSTGANHVYRDAENPNTITLILGWDTAENARDFLGSPQLREAMQKAGVAGPPAVSTVVTED